jgi:exonuclease SbcD
MCPRVENADDAYLEGIATLYAQVTELARSKKQAHQALIAMGHCHIVGGQKYRKTQSVNWSWVV